MDVPRGKYIGRPLGDPGAPSVVYSTPRRILIWAGPPEAMDLGSESLCGIRKERSCKGVRSAHPLHQTGGRLEWH